MISPFIVNDKNLFLSRFPIVQVNRSLQAWDAADEYLINYLNNEPSSLPESISLNCSKTTIAIFNDSFGAITTHFCNANIYATTVDEGNINEDNMPNIISINDSYLSTKGIQYNIEQNSLSDQNITQLTSLTALPENIDIILFKIPKSKSLLIDQLIQIKHTCRENTVFIAADRAKEIHSSTLKLFEKYLGTTTTSLAVKKARLVFCQLNTPQQHQPMAPAVWPLKSPKAFEHDFSITNLSNVYSRDSLDIGGRYFIENLPQVTPDTQVIDLGCGNGVVGLMVLAQQPLAQVQFIDESYMAIASAQTNVTNNLPEQLNQCQFHVNDCLTDVPSNSVDLILCNPPFHQHTATTDHIAWQMFKDSHRVLKKGGELRIIGNQKLAYHIKLKRIFGNERLVASNNKFVTLSAIKR
jgi:16S rRNA G1207 methylase RsmC